MDSNRLGDLAISRAPEFQVVIIVEYDDGRMFPLTEDIPKCLLPIANRPLLAYQLDTLEKSGAVEVYIVSPHDYKQPLAHFLAENVRSGMSVELVIVDEMLGSADGLRAVHDRIRGDFIVLGSDVISDMTMGKLVNLHRIQTSDITMLLSAVPAEEPEKKGGIKKINIDEEDQEYIGVCEDGRVVIKIPALELDGGVSISKPLLRRCSGLSVRNDLLDMGLYVFAHWIIEFLTKNRTISSIRTDLIPYIVNRQFQSSTFLNESIPGFQHRKRPLHVLESWLVSTDPQHLTSSNFYYQETNLSDMLLEDNEERIITNNTTSSTATSTGATSSSSTSVTMSAEDPLRCFSIVLDEESLLLSQCICHRLTNIQTYLDINRDIGTMQQDDKKHLWTPITGYRKKELSVVGDSCELGDKVTIKQCTIGANCKIGPRSKVNSCVIMNGVQIGDSCTIQNSVVCTGAVIEGNCNLNECYIGSGSRIPTGSKMKSEAVSSAGNA